MTDYRATPGLRAASAGKGASEALQNRGRRSAMDASGPPGALTAQRTMLLSQRVSEPREWVVTLATVLKDMNQTAPWRTAADAPLLGDSAVLRCALRWGAGSAIFATEFDYPLCGCAFGLVADSLELSVFLYTPGTVPTFATSTPVVGAFIVEAVPSEPTPLRWLELYRLVSGPSPNNRATYLVRPFARQVRIASTADGGGTGWTVAFNDADGNGRWSQSFPAGTLSALVDVPALAVTMEVAPTIVSGSPTSTLVYVEWRIGYT